MRTWISVGNNDNINVTNILCLVLMFKHIDYKIFGLILNISTFAAITLNFQLLIWTSYSRSPRIRNLPFRIIVLYWSTSLHALKLFLESNGRKILLSPAAIDHHSDASPPVFAYPPLPAPAAPACWKSGSAGNCAAPGLYPVRPGQCGGLEPRSGAAGAFGRLPRSHAR